MYSAQQMYSLTQKPLMGKLKLDVLQEYYDTYLRPFKYDYVLSDGTSIELKFEKKHFCHLVGIETVAKKVFNSERKLQTYRGERGYKRVKRQEITFKHLRDLHRPTANSVENKWIFFYLIPHIIESPEVVIKYKKIQGSNIECEFLIFELKYGVCIHLGIEKDNSGLFYIPRTFFVQGVTAQSDEYKYVDGQTKVAITSIQQTDRSTGKIVKQLKVVPPKPSPTIKKSNNKKASP